MAIKKYWSIPKGDHPVLVYGIALIVLIIWCLTLGAFPMTYKLVGDDNEYTIGGWWYKFFPKK